MEISHGRSGQRGGFGGGFGGGGRGGYMGAQEILEKSRNKGTAYRAIVKGLPASASWQDLKVHPYFPLIARSTAALKADGSLHKSGTILLNKSAK